MPRAALEVADIFRRHGAAYRAAHPLPVTQLRVMRAIEVCRTATLGGHIERCDNGHCQYMRNAYNSCRNRHCPKCQRLASLRWLESRQAELLVSGLPVGVCFANMPVEYFHVVFTLPEQIAELAFYNQEVLYGILFRAASQALLAIGADPKHLGAQLGFFAVLHTWGQNLQFHPHLHVVVPGGGLSPDAGRFVPCRHPRFFLPVKVLSALFRRLFLEALEDAFYRKRLQFPGSVERLKDAALFHDYLYAMENRPWVVYAKPPFGGPQQALKYLARYTHRVAISNQRLLELKDGQVSFQWKDYREADKRQSSKTLTVSADEFMRRFLMHTLPPGFQRIRFFGFLANRFRKEKLVLCRQLLHGVRSTLLPPGRRLSKTSSGARRAVPSALSQMPMRPPATHPTPARLPLASRTATRFLMSPHLVRSPDRRTGRASGLPRSNCVHSPVFCQSRLPFAASFALFALLRSPPARSLTRFAPSLSLLTGIQNP